MRWLLLGSCLGLLAGGARLLLDARRLLRGPSRTDEADLAVLVGGGALIAGVFVLAVFAVTA